MSGLMNTQSRKMFEIGKAAAIAETIINTYKAATGAYSALASIPYVGPALGAAAAAAAVAAGLANVQMIRSQTFGGGGGAVGTFQASPTTGLPVGSPAPSAGASQQPQRQTVLLDLRGGSARDQEVAERLVETLNEHEGDGGRVISVRRRGLGS
jgi:hypothetical protein